MVIGYLIERSRGFAPKGFVPGDPIDKTFSRPEYGGGMILMISIQ